MVAAGKVAEGFEPVRKVFGRIVGGSAGGGALAVQIGGETVVDLWTGHASHGSERRPWTPDTLAICFSTTKGVASMIIHRLADRGEVAYDEPVATY